MSVQVAVPLPCSVQLMAYSGGGRVMAAVPSTRNSSLRGSTPSLYPTAAQPDGKFSQPASG